MIRIRPAGPIDVDGIAHIHVASSRGDYSALLPQCLLAEQSADHRASQWREHLRDPRLIAIVGVGDAGCGF
jgi:hypothetical protein